ncbi:MAG: dephospho-CoA kinase [Desulfobacteraceae bacterium]|nr:dephospho-CoA kinase [Desulfobacteraceae bacterium]
MLRIGVTGSAGSGKSMVCQAFKALGLVTLDCDKIARQVVEPGQKAYEKVVTCFGRDVIKEDKTLDRAMLRNLMVNRPDLRKQLEALLHPLIIEQMVLQIKTAVYDREPACAVEVPLLFELGMEDKFDVTVLVVATQAVLLERISMRDKVSIESAGKMLDLQMSQSEKIKSAGYVIENIGKSGELFSSVGKIYAKIKKEFLTRKL